MRSVAMARMSEQASISNEQQARKGEFTRVHEQLQETSKLGFSWRGETLSRVSIGACLEGKGGSSDGDWG